MTRTTSKTLRSYSSSMSYVAALATLLEMFPTVCHCSGASSNRLGKSSDVFFSLNMSCWWQMPREVVEAVLKDHGGNLQAATEALLAASGEDHSQSVRHGHQYTFVTCMCIKIRRCKCSCCCPAQGTSASTSQVWQDEELARAMQVRTIMLQVLFL